jgi:hypothetical protein
MGGNEDIRLGVVLFLPAKKHFQVFNAGKHYDNERTDNADEKHGFENSHQHGNDEQTHKQTMVFETGRVDQFPIFAEATVV